MVKIDNYYLDIKKVFELEKEERNRIFELYRDMTFSYDEGRHNVASSFFNTLFHSGFLIDLRDEKIDSILDDNSINS
jgi:hypothetical protein